MTLRRGLVIVVLSALVANAVLLTVSLWSRLTAEPEKVEEPKVFCKAACLHDGRLVCLLDKGDFAVWDVKSNGFEKDAASRFAKGGLSCLTSVGKTLWAADKSTVYRWSDKDGAWAKIAELDAAGEEPVALVSVGEAPFVVFPSKVVDATGGRTFKAPKLDGPLQGPPLRILATHGTDSMLWIGTGRGEWGGTLVGLEPKTEKWVHWGDLLGYVTGITQDARGDLAVSWSMSHFNAHTRTRVHKQDATVATEHRELGDKYYQSPTFSPYDSTLYALESRDLVTVKDGAPQKVVTLSGHLFVREPDAIGVAPGIVALIPAAPKTVFVIPRAGEPWVYRDGNLTRLRVP